MGASLAGKKALIIDDVITAGTAINEAVDIIKNAEGIVTGIVIALDRQETTVDSDDSAVQAVAKRFGVPVLSIVGLEDIITHLADKLTSEQLESIIAYKKQYGSKK